MRTIFLAIVALLASFAAPVSGATSADQILQATQGFVDQWAKQQSEQGYEIIFEVGHIDSRVSLAECNQPLETSFTGDPLQTTRPSVQVSCSGERPWRMYVSTTLEIHGLALVAARPLARGERLTEELVSTQNVQLNASRKGVLTQPENIAGMMMRRPVSAGTLITPDLLEAPNAVARGDHVIIVAKSKSFSISSRGKALEDAGIGEQVRVQNLSSSRTIQGTVIAVGRVEIPM
ncbi:MAG: flagellar basal body P-ring formation chaperone FlgA [Pseudomonadota bacterium]